MTYIGLDASEFERTIGGGSNTPLPAGFYKGVITRGEVKDTNDKTGKYVEVEFDISEPIEHSNRKFWDKFNFVNHSAVAVKIGKEQLADLMQAIGLAKLGEVEELVGASCSFVLKVEPPRVGKNGKEYGASNACLKYLPIEATMADYEAWYAAKKGGVASAPTQVAAPKPAAATPSWKKSK